LGKRALVTGGGAGIGRAICKALAEAGAHVAVTDRDADAARRVAAELGDGHVWAVCDVTSATSVDSAVAEVARNFGGIDILCANAGVSTMKRVQELSEAEWDLNLAVNAKGVFLTNRAAP
jgi:NAD(P)-dependent dehydrogenase (short-subunit alcohol dehydrogenase family)